MVADTKHNHVKSLVLLIKYTDNLKLVKAIRDAYAVRNLNDIIDVEIRGIVEAIQTFSDDLFRKGIKTPKAASYYFEASELPEDIKQLVHEMDFDLTPEVLAEETVSYAIMRHGKELNDLVEELTDATDKLNKSGLSGFNTKYKKLANLTNSLSKLTTEISIATTENDTFVINPNETETSKSFGTEGVEQAIRDLSHNPVSTGMWIDNLTGGGFRAGCLYVIAALPSRFKSGFMLNVGEYISMHHNMDDFIIPNNSMPAILYINLEMSERQINERRCYFYGEDPNEVLFPPEGDDEKGVTFADRMKWMLKKHGSNIPIITQNTNEGSTILDIETKISECERLGYKVVMLITDYLDLFDNDWSRYREANREEPLTMKAVEQRTLAKKLRIPVLTGAQLNRSSEEDIHKVVTTGKARIEDVAKRMNASMLAKAHGLKQKVECLWFCYNFILPDEVDGKEVNRTFLGIVVDKDRDHVARYVPSEYIKRNENKYINTRKKDTNRVHYVCELNGLRMSETVYSDTISDLLNNNNLNVTASIMSTDNSVDEIEDIEVLD